MGQDRNTSDNSSGQSHEMEWLDSVFCFFELSYPNRMTKKRIQEVKEAWKRFPPLRGTEVTFEMASKAAEACLEKYKTFPSIYEFLAEVRLLLKKDRNKDGYVFHPNGELTGEMAKRTAIMKKIYVEHNIQPGWAGSQQAIEIYNKEYKK